LKIRIGSALFIGTERKNKKEERIVFIKFWLFEK